MTSAPSESQALQAALEGWGMQFSEMERVTIGVSRSLWKANGHFLVAESPNRHDRFIREQSLLAKLSASLKDEPGSPQVPTPLATTLGAPVHIDSSQWVWQVTPQIPCRQGALASPSSHRLLADAWRTLRPHFEVLTVDDSVTLVDPLDEAHTSSEDSFALDFAAEVDSVEETLDSYRILLRDALQRLQNVPRSLIHGDWIVPNIGFAEDYSAVVAVFDVEEASWSSPMIDLAQMVSGILVWSGIPQAEQLATSILDELGVKHEEVFAAMVVYWWTNFTRLHSRWSSGESHILDPLKRQPNRLASVEKLYKQLLS